MGRSQSPSSRCVANRQLSRIARSRNDHRRQQYGNMDLDYLAAKHRQLFERAEAFDKNHPEWPLDPADGPPDLEVLYEQYKDPQPEPQDAADPAPQCDTSQQAPTPEDPTTHDTSPREADWQDEPTDPSPESGTRAQDETGAQGDPADASSTPAPEDDSADLSPESDTPAGEPQGARADDAPPESTSDYTEAAPQGGDPAIAAAAGPGSTCVSGVCGP